MFASPFAAMVVAAILCFVPPSLSGPFVAQELYPGLFPSRGPNRVLNSHLVASTLSLSAAGPATVLFAES